MLKRLVCTAAGLLVCAGIVVYFFQSSPDAEAESQSAWNIECQEASEGKPKLCWMGQRIFLNQEKEGKQEQVGQLLNITVTYTQDEAKQPVLSLGLPLGVNLKAGVALRVDENEEMKAPYEQCTKAGCLVSSALTDEILEQFRKGKALRVAVLPYGSEKPLVIDVSLNGFGTTLKKL